ncbi:unnamed protein product [Caenorhabditis auriculariae]|uniref:Uncharacterized protein n=1 Tax=Caenorhabditis auriculariae TaxID=2777116 RepID=A0A8S1HQ96_9PELO|nr:unnamed protein product [Caenorhabditis auriculariae]
MSRLFPLLLVLAFLGCAIYEADAQYYALAYPYYYSYYPYYYSYYPYYGYYGKRSVDWNQAPGAQNAQNAQNQQVQWQPQQGQ